jgi:hypothetical protein
MRAVEMRSYLRAGIVGIVILVGGCGGCKVGDKYQNPQDPVSTNQFGTGFNDEVYIWEAWEVPGPRK